MDLVTVAQRYELRSLIGKGSFGEVHLAFDKRLGRTVAIKLLDPEHNHDRWQIRAEISALRGLDIPGVVRLLDEGFDQATSQSYIAMELVEGTPFPGERDVADWAGLEPLVLKLLRILGRVHSAGVVHRDLKPHNILVTANGEPFVLDFGLAHSPVTRPDARQAAGTPWYMAPEQLTGACAATAQSDLYALGILIVEALTGRILHRSEVQSLPEFVRLRAGSRLDGQDSLPEGLPEPVDKALRAMLAREPTERPRSALDLVRALRGDSPLLLRRALPFLGRSDVLDTLEEAACAGRSEHIEGVQGSGRSRHLHELKARLEKRGVACLLIEPGTGRLSALAPIIGEIDTFDQCSDGQSFLREASRRLEATVGDGVLLVDDADALDWTTRQILDACGPSMTTVRATLSSRGTGIELLPLEETDIQPLFGGLERIHHVPLDAARALWLRTGGLPARIEAEIAAWIEAGLAAWEGDHLIIERKSLRLLGAGLRLRTRDAVRTDPRELPGDLPTLLAWIAIAWPNTQPELLSAASHIKRFILDTDAQELARRGWVRRLQDGRLEPCTSAVNPCRWPVHKLESGHLDVAMCLEAGSEGRLSHLIIGRALPEDVAVEALALADLRDGEGRVEQAAEALIDGLLYVREANEPASEPALLARLVRTAMLLASEEALDRALYELDRAHCQDLVPIERLRALVEAAQMARHTGTQALGALDQLGPFEDPELELWRHVARFRASQRCKTVPSDQLVADIEDWNQREGKPLFRGIILGMRGLVLYQQRDFEQAALYHAESAEIRVRPSAVVSSLLNAAAANLDAGHTELALAQAQEARYRAEACRHALYEAYAEHRQRSALYRLEQTSEVDLELIEAIVPLKMPVLEGQIRLSEAAVAWRLGKTDQASELAESARQIWLNIARPWPAMLAEALALTCRYEFDDGEIDDLAARATQNSDWPRVTVQILGLLGELGEAPTMWLRAAAAAAEKTPRGLWTIRNEVLSIQESLDRLQQARTP